MIGPALEGAADFEHACYFRVGLIGEEGDDSFDDPSQIDFSFSLIGLIDPTFGVFLYPGDIIVFFVAIDPRVHIQNYICIQYYLNG